VQHVLLIPDFVGPDESDPDESDAYIFKEVSMMVGDS
jgi:hypothetical protein